MSAPFRFPRFFVTSPAPCPYLAGKTERKVFTVSGAHFDWSAVLGAAQAMSLFADRQLIEIRIPGGKPGKLSNGGSSEAVDMKSIRRLFDQVRTPQYAGKPVVEIEGLAPATAWLCRETAHAV